MRSEEAPATSIKVTLHLRGASCLLAARRRCWGAEPFHPGGETAPTLFVRHSFPNFHVSASCFAQLPAAPGSGVDADLFHCTIHVRRFSRCLVDARGVPCGGGSVRHFFGAKSHMLGGETPPVVIPSGSRRRANCVWHPSPPAANNPPTPKAVNRSIRAWTLLSPTWQELARLPQGKRAPSPAICGVAPAALSVRVAARLPDREGTAVGDAMC
ncbi:hypothetical protein TcCL_Unassigned04066 [Trypanosoma cruzi]|nr:hypothetical protein TcCL_Unassigned04066 [Trypanosoma cruzi]